MRTVLLLLVVALLAAPGLAVGQQRPDFSGEWTLDRPASSLQGDMAAVESGVVRIAHREPSFRF